MAVKSPTEGASIQKPSIKQDSIIEAQARRKTLAEHYKAEERVEVYLSPMYRPYFGNVMCVAINGISIYFPVDGKPYKVPKTFADAICERRMAIDAILNKQDRMANVSANSEQTPGELSIF